MTTAGAAASPATRLAAHLVLVGLPGVGKSSVGEAVAGQLGARFIDFDVEIERREGATIAELFRDRGEPYFRMRERELTVELARAEPMVLAPGGGWMAQPGLAALLSPPARIIYLAASPGVVAARLGATRSARPLLAGADPVARLAGLLAEREQAYLRADVVVNTELIDVQQVIRTVRELAPVAGAR